MKYTIEELYKKQGEIVCPGCRNTGGMQVSFIDQTNHTARLTCRCKDVRIVELEEPAKTVAQKEVKKKK